MTVVAPQIDALEVRTGSDVPREPTGVPAVAGLDTVDYPRNKPLKSAGNEARRNDRFRLDWAYADECIEAMQRCGTEGKMFVHNRCGARILIDFRCDERACRTCSPRRSRRLRRRYEPVVRKFKRPALFGLTIRNVTEAGELPGALETLTKGFEKLRRSRAWPKCPGFWALEITWSTAKGYHPHIHALIDFPWLEDWVRDMGRITSAWRARTGALVHPDLKRPGRDKAAVEGLYQEALKYVTKQWELDDSVLRAILAVIGHRRLCNGFGGFECAEEDEESGACCPKCHDPLAFAWKNFTRVTMPEKELAAFKADLQEYGRVYTDWFYADREPAPSPDPDIPPNSI